MHPEADAGVSGETAGDAAAQGGEETEYEEFADWRALFLASMWEYWCNEEGAVYDSL